MAKIKTGIRINTTTQDQPIEEVWIEYKRTGTEQLRNRLMEHYLSLVKYNAERIHSKLPDEVDIEDLMSAGVFGLMDTIDAFDMERGIKFETYCAPRIRGAILDELRSMDWVPRLVRSRTEPGRDRQARAWRCSLAASPPTKNCSDKKMNDLQGRVHQDP